MLDYFKERIALDFNFFINYWWVYVIIVLILVVVIFVGNEKR
jgi:type IV secretory pathway TrbL component